MGRHTKGRRKRDERGGPSIWFFLALAIGIALLIWAAVTVARTPVQVPEKPKTMTEVQAPSSKLQALSSRHVTLSRVDGEESQAARDCHSEILRRLRGSG